MPANNSKIPPIKKLVVPKMTNNIPVTSNNVLPGATALMPLGKDSLAPHIWQKGLEEDNRLLPQAEQNISYLPLGHM